MYHKVVIIGNLTRDPEMRYTSGGTAVTNLNVATRNSIPKTNTPECPDGWKDGYQGKTWEQTIFWRVTVWGAQAEAANQFLSKGRQVYIEGTMNGTGTDGVLNPRVWQGNDGVSRASFEVTARTLKFLGGRAGAGGGADYAEGAEEPPADFVEENDIPF